MLIRALEKSGIFFIFHFSPLSFDSPALKPLPQGFPTIFLAFQTFFGVLKKNFCKASPPYCRGKKLVEFDLDLLKMPIIYLSQILFFSLPVFERYDAEAKISNFSSLIWCVVTLFFIQALQNATFAVKNTAVSQKLSKLAIFHLFSRDFFFLSFPVFERYDTEAKISNFLPFVCLFVC